MELLPPKTPEQIQPEHNAKIQNEIWGRNEKISCAKMALNIAQGFDCPDAEQTIKQAGVIYEWLIKEVK